METHDPSSHSQSSTNLIHDWQATALVQVESTDSGIIARLANGCLNLLDALLQAQAESHAVPRKSGNALRRIRATLKLWTDGHQVREGKLDDILERSKSLRFTTLRALNAVCKVLISRLSRVVFARSEDARRTALRSTNALVLYEQTKWLLAGSDGTSSDSGTDSSSEEEDGDEINEIVNDLKSYVQCLIDLNNSLECPAIDPDYEADEASIPRLQTRAAHDYYADLITAKFPQASIEIADQMGKANWERYQRLQVQRKLNIAREEAEDCTRTAASKSIIADSEFKDSGLGSSALAQSSYAQSVISILSSVSGGVQLPIPPLSAQAKNGLPFECVACGMNVTIQTNRDWRRHLFKDLQPYSCFEPSCYFIKAPFQDRQLWAAHLELQHNFGPSWDDTQCPLCNEHTGTGKTVILRHFARHMEDIALAALPRGVDSEGNSEVDSDEEIRPEDLFSGVDYHEDVPSEVFKSFNAASESGKTTAFTLPARVPTNPMSLDPELQFANGRMMRKVDNSNVPEQHSSGEDVSKLSNLARIASKLSPLQTTGQLRDRDRSQRLAVSLEGQPSTVPATVHTDYQLQCPRCQKRMDTLLELNRHLDQNPLCELNSSSGSDEEEGPALAPEKPKICTYFIPGDGIAREVITADIQRYLGPDAVVRAGLGDNEYRSTSGYWISAYRRLTTGMIEDLRLDSTRWTLEGKKAKAAPRLSRDVSPMPPQENPALDIKRCHSCNRADTPQWRRGPDGPGTLCETCGLHYAIELQKWSAEGVVSTTAGNEYEDAALDLAQIDEKSTLEEDTHQFTSEAYWSDFDESEPVLRFQPSDVNWDDVAPFTSPTGAAPPGSLSDLSALEPGEHIYLPGDEIIGGKTTPRIRSILGIDGFPCEHPSCGKTFNRAHELRRHAKVHQTGFDRPHKCQYCNQGFLYPKDRVRHERTHSGFPSSSTPLFCVVPGCDSVGFSRRDNLLRHHRKHHPGLRDPDEGPTHDNNVTHRDTMFCFGCQNEWFRDEHGLTCPECASDFTEVRGQHDSRSISLLCCRVDGCKSFSFPHRDGLLQHYRENHPDELAIWETVHPASKGNQLPK